MNYVQWSRSSATMCVYTDGSHWKDTNIIYIAIVLEQFDAIYVN